VKNLQGTIREENLMGLNMERLICVFLQIMIFK
jgi:hypothetical protein